MIYKYFFLFLLICCFIQITTSASLLLAKEGTDKTDWSVLAAKIDREETTIKEQQLVEEIIKQLKEIPNLENELKTALTGNKASLALKVIKKLQLKNLLPDLIIYAEKIEQWGYFETINSLLDQNNTDIIKNFYQKELVKNTIHRRGSVLVAIIVGAEKTNLQIGNKIILELFSHPEYEVRTTAVTYVGLMLEKRFSNDYFKLLVSASEISPYQSRLEALKWIVKFKVHLDSNNQKEINKKCLNEKQDEFKIYCSEFEKNRN